MMMTQETEMDTVDQSNKTSTRCNSIDLVRMVIALSVMGVHGAETFCENGFEYSGVIGVFMEFFFMVSGFFMMSHIDGLKNDDETSITYVLHKIKGFFAPLCIVNAVQFFIHCRSYGVNTIGAVFGKLWHFKWEFILLQCAGFIQNPQFNTDYLLGPAWYLSAMVIALLLVYPLARHYRKFFIRVFSPAMLLFVYCGLIQSQGYKNWGAEFTFIISDAVARAVAATGAGSICYEVCRRLRGNTCEGKGALKLLDLLSWLSVPFCLLLAFLGNEDSPVFLMIPFAGILIFALLNVTPVSRKLNALPSGAAWFLGKMSLYIYLTHMPAMHAVKLLMPDAGGAGKALAAVSVTAVFSALLYVLDKKRRSVRPVVVICAVIIIASFAAAAL